MLVNVELEFRQESGEDVREIGNSRGVWRKEKWLSADEFKDHLLKQSHPRRGLKDRRRRYAWRGKKGRVEAAEAYTEGNRRVTGDFWAVVLAEYMKFAKENESGNVDWVLLVCVMIQGHLKAYFSPQLLGDSAWFLHGFELQPREESRSMWASFVLLPGMGRGSFFCPFLNMKLSLYFFSFSFLW